MDLPSIDTAELDATRDDDLLWLGLKEESLLFNEAFVISKFYDLDDERTEEEEDGGDETTSAQPISKGDGDTKGLEESNKLIGLVEVEEAGFKKKAIYHWTKELIEAYSSPKESESSFLNLLRKKLEVQQRLHKAYLREKERENRAKSTTASSAAGDGVVPSEVDSAHVPVVVRLGVLSLFPIIESLSSIKDVNYASLCSQMLNMLLSVLSTLPALALHKEPADCLDAFRDFTYNLIKGHNFIIDSEDKARSVHALVGLAISRGNAKELLLITSVLFNVYQNMGSRPVQLSIGPYLKQLANHRKNEDLAALFERGYGGSWTVGQLSLEPSMNAHMKYDEIACDGSYLYIHTLEKGLRKIGTGYGQTILGHVYRHNKEYRKGDRQKSLACIDNCLYYLNPQPHSAQSIALSTSISTSLASFSSLASEPIERKIADNEEQDTRVQVTIINTKTLLEEAVVTLKESVVGRSYLIGDGKLLYLVSRQQKAADSKSGEDKFVVDIFEPSTMKCIKTIELGNVSVANESTGTTSKEPALPVEQWEKLSMYTTGYQLAVLLPGEPATMYTKIRLFSLMDGSHIDDFKMRSESCTVCICFDSRRNLFWLYNEDRIEIWKNLTLATNYNSFSKDPTNSFPPFSPEAILAGVGYQPTKSETFSPLDAILIILANMDRLARQHPIYGERTMPEVCSSVESEYLYCVQVDAQLFQFLHSILVQTLSSPLPDDTKSYIWLVCTRLLKVNIYELVTSETTVAGSEDALKKSLAEIRVLMENFVETEATTPSAKMIQDNACSVLSLGLDSFYPEPLEQSAVVLHLLEGSHTLSEGKRILLETILIQFSNSDHAADILLQKAPSKEDDQKKDKMEVDASVSKMEIDQKEAGGKSQRLLSALLQHVFDESRNTIASPAQLECSPLITPALRLLLVLQRDVVSNIAYSHLIVDHTSAVLNKCKELIEFTIATHEKNLSDQDLHNALRSSMVGAVLPSLCTSMCRKKYSSDPALASAVLPPLIGILSAVDKLNNSIPQIAESDRRYPKRFSSKKDKKYFVESKHPYPQGKQQLKQTITIHGAEALCLHFDSRSRTASNSSDMLQLFKSAALNDPVVTGKDGKAIIFSGTNFPKQAILVPGESVTFLFSASTRPDNKNPDNKSRWGFQCRVTAFTPADSYDLVIDDWLLDLESSLAAVGGKYASTLIEGEVLSDQERKYLPWLEATLLNGGLEDNSEVAEGQFFEQFIKKEGDAKFLAGWMEKYTGRRVLSALAKPILESTERYVMAAMLKQLYMVNESAELIETVKKNQEYSNDLVKQKFISIAQEAGKITTSLQQKGQAEKEWRISVEEKPTLESFFNTWKEEKKDKLMEMCEIKQVEFNSHDDQATIQRLYEKLQEDMLKLESKEEIVSPYEYVSRLVVDRAKMLLRMRPAKRIVEHPSAETPNPFAVHRDSVLGAKTKTAVTTGAIDSPPNLRASSHHPKTEAEISKEAKQARDEQKSKAFTRRLKELRKWLQAYKSWKQWKESGVDVLGRTTPKPPRSPLHAVSSFVQSSLSTQELEGMILAHARRAETRIEGLQYFKQLLSTVSYCSARQQLLSCLGPPLSNGGHYLDNIPTCGLELTARVADAFAAVFEHVVKILRDRATDTTSRLLALTVCGISYQEFDVELLRDANIFPLLQQLVTDCNSKISIKITKSIGTSFAKDSMQIEAKDNQGATSDKDAEKKSQLLKEQRNKEQLDEIERQKKLRSSAWTAFRLLAARCVGWESEMDDVVLQTDALKELQDQIFELMCSELKSISQKANIDLDDGDQCFELLSLLCLLGGSAKGRKSLSREENLSNLISILKTNAAAPRAKRLALRLCRKLLPSQTRAMPRLVEFFLQEIGDRLFTESVKREKEPEIQSEVEAPSSPLETEQIDDPIDEDDMDEDEEGDDDEDDDDEEDFEGEEEQYAIYLNNWTSGHQRLIEVCHNSLGADFFGQSGTLDRTATESRAQQIIQEMIDEGKALLKKTSLAHCNILASSIAAMGGTVTVAAVPVVSPEEKGDTIHRNKRKLHKKTNPTMWTSGRVARGLASEFIFLLRQLLDKSKGSDSWAENIRQVLTKVLHSIPTLLSGEATTKQALLTLAAFGVLGGHSENLHVGGKVRVFESDEMKEGVVVGMPEGTDYAEVIFESESAKTPRKVVMGRITPMSELEFDPSLFSFTGEMLTSILSLVRHNEKTPIPSWLFVELKAQALKVLTSFSGHLSYGQLFLQEPGSSCLTSLVKLAQEAKPNSRLQALEERSLQLSEMLWDKITKPRIDSEDMKVKMMSDILPHFPYSHMAELLPTTWNSDKLQGFIFREDKRKLEYVGFDLNPLGRRSYISRAPPVQAQEVVVCANIPIPSSVPEYYFEVTIDQAESNGSLMSVGIAPEGSKTWGNGSYRYQANAKKTTFSGSSRRQNDYGAPFRAKSVIGCGWNREEKTIYFTKDGTNQGAAFLNVNLGKVTAAVGVTKGVNVTVNFGQDPFQYKLVVEGETEEQREQRKKEEEEKTKEELKKEKERRKKEKEDEKAANVMAAQPIMQMGFTLTQALAAMKRTNYAGTEVASNWLLENMSYNFEEEQLSDKEEDEEEEEKKEEAEVEQPKEEEPKEEKEEEEKPKETSYDITNSQLFFLADNYSFVADEAFKEKEASKAASEWEDHVIPAIRGFMEKDGFSPFEVEEYIQQIRTQLSNSNDQQAKAIIMQIVGDAGLNIQFPSANQAPKSGKPSVKVEEIKTGMWVQISQNILADIRQWIPQMDKTKGKIGIVKAVDHQSNLILVQFYNAELAVLNEWWYPVKALEKPEQGVQGSPPSLTLDVLQDQIVGTMDELTKIYARKTVMSILSNFPLKLSGTAIVVKDALNLAAFENVSNALISIPGETSPDSPQIRALRDRLLAIYDTGEATDPLTQLLIKETANAFKLSANSTMHSTQIVSSKPPFNGAQLVRLEEARTMTIVFDRAGTHLPPNCQAALCFYEDEACTTLIKSFQEKSKFFPFSVATNEIWLKLHCQSQQQRANVKYKFSVVPVHPAFGMAFWLTNFLIKHARKYIADFPSAVTSLFNAAVNYVYSANIPSQLKESMFYLIGNLVRVSVEVQGKRLPLERLGKLKEEMVLLFDAEKSRANNLHSSYLQSLVELMVYVKESGGMEGLEGEDIMDLDMSAEDSRPVSKDDEELQIAIALTSTITGQKSEPSEAAEPAAPTEPVQAEPPKAEPPNAEPMKERPLSQPDPELFPDMMEEGLDLMDEDEMDEDTRRALEMSMQASTPQEKEKSATEATPVAEKEKEKEGMGSLFGAIAQLFGAPKKQPAAESAPSLVWLDAVYEIRKKLNALLSPREHSRLLKLFVKEAYKSTKKECIKDRVLLVDNLPLLTADKLDELEAVLKRTFSDIAQVTNIFIPLDEGGAKMKGFAFLEVVSPQKVDQVIKKMNRHKLKAPHLFEEISLKGSLRDTANLPRGIVQIHRYLDLEKAEDPKTNDYLLGKLSNGATLTTSFQAVLTEIFFTYGGDKHNLLLASQLNELQLRSNGKTLSREQLDFLFKNYKSKPIGEEFGLTLEGFIDLYTRQCREGKPSETWDELFNLGYDLNLNRARFVSLEEAYHSQLDWTPAVDAQLAEYVEMLYTESEVSSPTFLTLDHIKPFTASTSGLFPQLAKRNLPSIRLRFELFRQLNAELPIALPLINLERVSSAPGSISWQISKARGLIFHSTKMDFIYDTLDKTSVQGGQPVVTIDRLKLALKKEKQESPEASVNHTMFGIAFQQLRNADPAKFRQRKPGGTEPHFSITIVFKGENVQGEGGPYRQFFTDVSKELLGVLPLFIPCPNAHQGLGENRDKWIIAPSCKSPSQISMFEFLGRLMGMAIRTGVLLTLDLPSFFWKPLVGLQSESADLNAIDESLYGTLKYFSECSRQDLERDIDETFTTFLSDKTKVPLIKGADNIKVSFENRDEYVKLVEKTRLQESQMQTAAIRRGIAQIVPLSFLNLCTWKDLEWKVCGKPLIDIHLLKRHTTCSGVSPDAPHIAYFWQTLQEFNQQDRRGFLRFAWAQERLPVNDEEFERTKTRMMIKPFSGLTDPNAAFPKADTCFFNIMIPEYTSQRILRDRMLYAIYTDSHSMNADEPQEDELATVNGGRRPLPGVFDYSSESDSE